jgi:hypothetical protein
MFVCYSWQESFADERLTGQKVCFSLNWPETDPTRYAGSEGVQMSAPVPEVFKVCSLHRYFLWAITMQDHYEKAGQRFSPTPSFFENEAANEAFMYLS